MITAIEKEKLDNYFNNNITNVNKKEKELIMKYKNSLDEHELIAMVVGIDILKSSFDIKKSQGYLKWKEKNTK
jgi:predicted LPLAT superfamily acyltransferase